MQLLKANTWNRAMTKVSWPFADKIRERAVIPISHWKTRDQYTVSDLWRLVQSRDNDTIYIVTDMTLCAC